MAFTIITTTSYYQFGKNDDGEHGNAIRRTWSDNLEIQLRWRCSFIFLTFPFG